MGFIVRGVIIPYLFAMLFFFGFVQLQYTLFGKVFIYSYQIKLTGFILLFVLFFFFILQKKKMIFQKSRLLFYITLYAAYILFQFIFHFVIRGMRIDAVVYGIVFFYFYILVMLLLLFFFYNVPSNINQSFLSSYSEKSFITLALIAIPIFGVGYLQFLLNDPLLWLGESDSYQVQSYIHLASDQTRAFSIFSSGYQFGHFITLIGALSTCYLLEAKRFRVRFFYFLLLVASVIAIYTTYTRNSYLEFAFSIFAIFFVKYAVKRNIKNSYIILFSFISGAIVFLGIIEYVRSVGLSGLLDPGSFLIRLYNQSKVLENYFLDSNDTIRILFGYGLMQGVKFSSLENISNIMIDNTYINIALFSGIVGLVLYLIFFILVFDFILTKFRETKNVWWQGLSALFFSYPIVASINIYLSQLLLFTCLTIAFQIKAALYMKRPVRFYVRRDARETFQSVELVKH